MKRPFGFLALATVAWVSCRVETSGLGNRDGSSARGGASGAGGARLDAGVDGTGGASMDGGPSYDVANAEAPRRDSAMDGTDASGVDGSPLGSGGATSLDGPRDRGAGGAVGDATDGPMGAGGGPGTGGIAGSGGWMGTGGSPLWDGGSGDDAIDASPDNTPDNPDVPMAPDLGPDSADDAAPDVAEDASAVDGPPVSLIWSDEFEGNANAGVDTAKWSYITWAAGHVNNEKQRYTNNRNNVFKDGEGHLVIRALYSASSANPYTSGRIDTAGKFSVGPGHRIEVRAKLPAGIGSFPGIVMMGTTGLWPQCGQLSIMEQYGQDKSWYYATAYAPATAGSGSTGNVRVDFPNATTASQDFHVYSVDWLRTELIFRMDGREVVRSSFAGSSPFAYVEESIVLDLALGGDMGGAIDNSAFPMDMVIDYVHVYAFD